MPDTSKDTKNPKDSSSSANTNGDECSDARPESAAKSSHRARNITIGVIVAVVVVAIVVCILVLAHPWESNDASDSSASGSISENSQQINNTEETNKPGDSPEGTNDKNDASDKDTDMDNDSSDGRSNASENSDGIINRDDYESEEEYMAAWIAAGQSEVQVEKEPVSTTEDGSEGYYKGILIIHFYYDLCDEEHAREIVSDLGGTWVSTTYARGSSLPENDYDVQAYFPDAPYADDLQPIADKLEAMPEVSSAYMDGYCSLDDKSNSKVDEVSDISEFDIENFAIGYSVDDIFSDSQQYLDFSRFRWAWYTARCNKDVEIAVFDSGIYLDHEDLADNIGTVMPYDAYNETVLQGEEQDTSGHGTMVAGIACAEANNSIGIAGCSYNAKIIPVRVTESGTSSVDFYSVERAFSYVFDLTDTPEVINMSFSGTKFQDSGQKKRLEALIDEAREDYGIVCVATVGNTGDVGDTRYPAAFDGVLGVGSVGADLQVSEFSTRNAYVDLVALGENVLSTANPEYVSSFYASSSGTSFAAPQVSAAAALLKAQHPSWSVDQVEAQLIATAVSLGDEIPNNSSGYGLLNAATAVEYTIPSDDGSDAGTSDGSEDGSSDGGGGSSGGNTDFPWPSPNTGGDFAEALSDYLNGEDG